jgi:aldose sugar dehydrogenase
LTVKRWIAGVAICAALLPVAGGRAVALPSGTKVQTYKNNLAFPVDMAWVKGTRKIFFTEKNTGKVRVMIGTRLLRRACVNLDVSSVGEQGALGIALHPHFKRNHKLYVYYTNDSPRDNRVTRFIVQNNRCRRPRNIMKGVAAGTGYHNGGQLEFVRGKLFVSVGENHNPSQAQRKGTRLGKILRYNADGSIPRTNPYSRPGDRNPVWSRGHRNPFGLTHKSGTGRLYETENGPNCDDELNIIRKGRNYGWGPGYTCGTAGVGPNPKRPLRRWTPPIVPTDPWFYKGRMGRLSGDLFVGDFSAGRLRRFHLNRTGTRVKWGRTIFNASEGIVDVAKGPGGWLYFMTAPDGKIKRIVPR